MALVERGEMSYERLDHGSIPAKPFEEFSFLGLSKIRSEEAAESSFPIWEWLIRMQQKWECGPGVGPSYKL